MKNFKYLLFVLIILPCMAIFTGCMSEPAYITKIEKVSTLENSIIYEITYSNGKVTQISTKNEGVLEDAISVIDISKNNALCDENGDTYTVYYSDSSTKTIYVKHGEDGANGKDGTNGQNGQDGANGDPGQDGKDLTLESIEQYCIENNLNFDNWIKDHLVVNNYVNSIQDSAEKALKSTVSVWSEFSKTTSNVKDISVSCGAGVIYKMNDDYSYIVTNYHVVYYKDSNTPDKIARSVKVFLYGGQEAYSKTAETDSDGYPIIEYGSGAIECEYIGGSMTYDLAVLRVETSSILSVNPEACAVKIADDYSVAETAIAIGNPEGAGTSVTSGIVSVETENLTMNAADEKTEVTFRVMRIDTAVNPGNSGGGLFNSKGELIGIVNAKIIDNEIDNIAYALPVDNIYKVANNIIYNFKTKPVSVKRLQIGVSYVTTDHHADFGKDSIELFDSVKVVEVVENSIAEAVGIETDDKITGCTIVRNSIVYNYSFSRAYELAELMLTIQVGDQITLFGERDGQNITYTSHTATEQNFIIVN